MKKIIRLTESDLIRLVKRVIKEQDEPTYDIQAIDCGINDRQQYYWDGENRGDLNKLKGSVDIDDETDTIIIRYCRGLERSLPRLKHQGKMKLKRKYEGIDFSDEDQDSLSIMRRHLNLGERDLSRFVKEQEEETTFDFTQTNNKLLSDFFTVKNDFKYFKNHNGMEIYTLKRKGFSVMVAVKPSDDTSNINIAVFLKFPMGKSINYLEEVKGVGSVTLPINDYNGMTRLLQGAVDFGGAQDDYDNLPPLPKY
jgi:hypothetical protein